MPAYLHNEHYKTCNQKLVVVPCSFLIIGILILYSKNICTYVIVNLMIVSRRPSSMQRLSEIATCSTAQHFADAVAEPP